LLLPRFATCTVLGVFMTHGWEEILPVASAFGGAILQQGFSAWNKRGERRHERASEYEKRNWEAKDDALKRLIVACRFVKERVQQAEAEQHADANYKRGAAIRALDQFRGKVGNDDGINEVMATAADEVCKALDEMLKVVRVQTSKHSDSLSALGGVGAQLYRLGRDPLEDVSGAEGRQRMERYESLMAQRKQALESIGSQSDLDGKKVVELCDRVIAAARKDREGR
jgi:hypothetical protein